MNPIAEKAAELKSCPFCGGEADHTVVTNDARISTRFTVICIAGCGASGKWCDTKEDAATAWNTRSPQCCEAYHASQLAGVDVESVVSNIIAGFVESNEARMVLPSTSSRIKHELQCLILAERKGTHDQRPN